MEIEDPGGDYYAGIAPPGSVDHYLLLFAEAPLRDGLRALLAVEKLLTELGAENVDPDVRQAKLGWWAAELDRLGSGAAVHPVARAAQSFLAERNVGPAPLNTLFEAVAREALDKFPDNPAAVLEHAGARGAIIELIGAAIAGKEPAEKSTRSMLREVGRSRSLAMVLADGHAPGATHASPARAATMLAELYARQRRNMDAGLAALTPDQVRAFLPLLVVAALLRRRLKALAAVPDANPPNAFAMLWQAWRSARRAARGRLAFDPQQGNTE